MLGDREEMLVEGLQFAGGSGKLGVRRSELISNTTEGLSLVCTTLPRALVTTQISLAPFSPGFAGEKGWG